MKFLIALALFIFIAGTPLALLQDNLLNAELVAIGRGGGGGGRVSGGNQGVVRSQAAHVSPSFSRTPSMSRVAPPRQATPAQTGVRAQERVSTYVQQRQPQTSALRHKDQNWVSQKQQHNAPAVNAVRSHVNASHPGRNNWFSNQFFSNHRYTPNYVMRDGDWWRGASWVALNNWVGAGWSEPLYYDEGGYYIQLPAESVAPTPVQTVPSQGEGSNWLPIGVFAAGTSVAETPYSNLYVQLAISRGGEIAGSYYNASTDKLHPIGGQIVNQTQEAAWTVSDNPRSPLMTTEVYDLTQDVVSVEVHFPEGGVQQWVLVRLDQPQ